ncbi:MAG: hypothetical protein K6L73_14580 [Cellvibrionaceae bacterium]
MFETGPSKSLLSEVSRSAKRDVSISVAAEESVKQSLLISELLSKAESAEREARDATTKAKTANNIAIVAILISTIFSIIGIIVSISSVIVSKT